MLADRLDALPAVCTEVIELTAEGRCRSRRVDGRIFAMGGVVSGHTLKHLMAALACWWLIGGTMARRPSRRVLEQETTR